MLPQHSDSLSNAIGNFLIRDLYQPSMVEGQGFKQLIRSLLPSNKELPSACMLEALMKDLHAKEKKRLRQLLRCKTASQEEEEENAFNYMPQPETSETFRHHTDMSHLVTLSVDVWVHVWQGETSRNATLWVHYIDANFDCQNWALTTQRLVATEKAGVEAQVKNMALEWGIPRSHLVLLGGDTVEKASLGLKRRNQRYSEPGGSDHAPSPHIPCFFAAVQGCVEEVMSFPVISETLRMFQDILSGLFTVFPKNNPFRPQIELLLLKIPLGERAHLQSWAHSPLSWKSIFTVINILNKHQKLVCDLIKLETGTIIKHESGSDSNAAGVVVPGESEWKVLQELCSVLKPMNVACQTLAKEAFPRLSLIKPILIGLLTRHLVSQPNDVLPLTKGVKMRMRERLAGCYENPVVNRILCVACSLDPQFRHLGFMEAKVLLII